MDSSKESERNNMRNIFFILKEINWTACVNVLVQYEIWFRLFRSGHLGIVYNVTQHDRLFTIGEDISDSPLFFAIDDKHGTHFFSYGNDGNTTFFRSGTIKSDDVFSTRMLTSSGGVVTAQTVLAVRNGTTAQNYRTASVHVHRPPAVTLNETPEEFHTSSGLCQKI